MAHTYEELSIQTVAQLREIAKGIENDAVRGYSTMHKEQLLLAICQALSIDTHVHHDVVGIDKRRIKAQIRKLKTKREAALAAKDPQELKVVRKKIRRLKRKIRRATI